MRVTWITAALAGMAGCGGGGDIPQPDASPPDAMPGGGGLTVRFTADQAVPGEVADDRTLIDVRLTAASVRAIGDAAPGDSRTTEMDYDLRWHESNAPARIQFDQAPVGLYSSVEVRLERPSDGGGDGARAFEIEGEARVEAVWHSYLIHGEDLLTIAIPTSTELAPGAPATILIDVDLGAIIAGIDFTAYPQVEGAIEIDGDVPAIRTAIRDAFGGTITAD